MKKFDIKALISKSQKILILLAIVLIMAVLQPGVFLTGQNIKSILFSISIYGIMICGTVFTIMLGGIDLSIGSICAAAGGLTVKWIVDHGFTNSAVIVGILLGLLLGIGAGLINGLIVVECSVPAFLVTLASQLIFHGVAQLITNSKVIAIMEPPLFSNLGGGRFLGIPSVIYVWALFVAIAAFILEKTVYGRQIYSVGGNAQASYLSGIHSKKVSVFAYVFSGFTAALAGIVLASMNRQAYVRAGEGYENDVLAAVVLGGISLMGGEGKFIGAVWGAVLVGIVGNALRLMGIGTAYHGIVKGIVVIIAVAVDAYVRFGHSGLKRNKKEKAKAKEN